MSAPSAPVRGSLEAAAYTEGPKKVEFDFNPAELTLTKSAAWKSKPQKNAKKAPETEFTGTGPRTLKMQLTFDSRAGRTKDVAATVDLLFRWTNPTAESIKLTKPQPPLLVLNWGAREWFPCYLGSLSVKYQMFERDGTPITAVVDVTLNETPASAEAQNPTSGGDPGRRSRTLARGETLHSVAFSEYGRPGHWRALAVANGIDDPLRLRPGTVLLVPSQADADRLA